MTSKEGSKVVLPPQSQDKKASPEKPPVNANAVPSAVVPVNFKPPTSNAYIREPHNVFGMHQGPFNMLNMPTNLAGKTGSHAVYGAAMVGGSVARPRSAHPVSQDKSGQYHALGSMNAPIIPRQVGGATDPPKLPSPEDFVAGILAG